MFKNRDEAALKLAAKLENYRHSNAIVLAVPRGGVPIGYVIARQLHLPMELVLSKKIGHPLNPELAIGSVSLHGTTQPIIQPTRLFGGLSAQYHWQQ